MNKNIGKIVTITDKYSIYCGEWGIVKDVDEDNYYTVAIAGDTTSMPIFHRSQIKIRRK